MGAASMTNAMSRLSAPQLGQVSGSDSNSRDLLPSGQHGPEMTMSVSVWRRDRGLFFYAE